ncbi:MAG: TlpA family protein disulfide reductase, partial [Deltaproteobacteria bacterium]|nr:TlpA family protein disulfide reductase [Deltaproteobacteria bacterium]
MTACASTPAPVQSVPSEPKPAVAAVSATAGVTVVDDAGASVQLDDLRARVTVVSLWAAYCTACSSRLEAIAQLAEHYRDDDDVEILLINVDEPDARPGAKTKAAERAPGAPSYYADGSEAITSLLPRRDSGRPVLSLPLVIVIDADQTVHHSYNTRQTVEAYRDSHRELVELARAGDLRPNDEPPPRTVRVDIRINDAGALEFTVVRAGENLGQVADTIVDLSGGQQLDAAGRDALRARIMAELSAGNVKVAVMPVVDPDAAPSSE